MKIYRTSTCYVSIVQRRDAVHRLHGNKRCHSFVMLGNRFGSVNVYLVRLCYVTVQCTFTISRMHSHIASVIILHTNIFGDFICVSYQNVECSVHGRSNVFWNIAIQAVETTLDLQYIRIAKAILNVTFNKQF